MYGRFGYLVLIAVALASEAGCTCPGDCWPNGKTWCGSECGEFYWHEWFSHKPECCDPCDRCGNYTRPTQRDAYSSGATRVAPRAAEPAAEYYPEPAETAPAEELGPGGPSEPSAAAHVNEFGEVVSYEAPVDSPNNSRKLGKPRRAKDSAW
ncbi:MAG TPA: hypothetical protein VGZ26_05865 [Pirellulales bacterium]|nr:hypothetical protein [Pirellulales bacterium]